MRVALWLLVVSFSFGGLASAQVPLQSHEDVPDPDPEPDGVPITITSVDATNAAPFSTLKITGTGFSPPTSAISVLIHSNAGASSTCSSPRGAKSPTIIPIAVPAYAATSTTVEIVVPPVINAANGTFTASAVKVQVVQVSNDTVTSSPIVPGLCISNLPQVPAKVPAGAVTRGYLNIGLNVLSNTLKAAKSSFKSKLTVLKKQQQTLATQVDRIVTKPTRRISLGTKDKNPFILDAEILGIADRLIAAQLKQLDAALSAQPSALTRAARVLAMADCSPNTSNKAIDTLLCEREVYHNTLKQQASAAWRAGAALYAGSALSDVAGWAAAGLSQAGASTVSTTQAVQVLWSAAVPYIANFAILKPAPPLSAPLASAFLQVANIGLSHGLPVTSEAVTAIKAYQDAAYISTASAPEPKGGLVISAPTTNTAGQPQAVFAFQTTNAPQTLSIPTTGAIVPINQSTIPPGAVSRFDGTYSGTFAGTAKGTELLTVSNGGIQITVTSKGTSIPGQGTGLVNATGSALIGFPPSKVTCTFGGRFRLNSSGAAQVSGGWKCTDGESGYWKAAR